MAFLLQYRALRKRVEEQINELNDEEKNTHPSPPRLSGLTQTAPEAGNNDTAGDKDKIEDQHQTDRYSNLAGITAKTNDNGELYYLVGWESSEDPQNPHNWSRSRRISTILILDWIAFVVTAASSIDATILMPASQAFHVSEVAESLATGIFLIGFGLGALLASPSSELVGRYPVYLATLGIFGCWLIGAALAPNFGAQLAFRFLAGCFASAPLTCCGGSISDMFNPKEKTWAFPIFGIVGFGGPTLGPVIGAYIGYSPHIDWRWTEWIMLVTDGLVIVLVLLFKRETLAPQLLKYKARHFRQVTGDQRFKSEMEAAGHTIGKVLKTNFSRPFILAIEPIVLSFTLYLTVIYIVLFTFLDGYTNIFEDIYGTNPGLTYIIFLGLFIGILSCLSLVPLVYHFTLRQLASADDQGDGTKLRQELRLLFAMIGAPFLPIGLFWMGWTDDSNISIWSPIIASVLVGFSIISIFLTAYMYIIDSYEMYAASALTFVALVRYLAAGGMTVVGVPMYENLGTHYTLTILACISAAVVPIPFALWKWGPKVRGRSKYAVSPGKGAA